MNVNGKINEAIFVTVRTIYLVINASLVAEQASEFGRENAFRESGKGSETGKSGAGLHLD
jgi:hypothetical protein